MAVLFSKIYNHGRKTILYVIGFLVVLLQFWVLPSGKYLSTLPPNEEASPLEMIRKSPPSSNLVWNDVSVEVKEGHDNTSQMREKVRENGLTFHATLSEDLLSMRKSRFVENGMVPLNKLPDNAIMGNIKKSEKIGFSSNFSVISSSRSGKWEHEVNQVMKSEGYNKNDSFVIERYVRKMRGATITFSEMKTMLLERPTLSTSMRRRVSTSDRQLLSASQQIKNAPILRSISDLHAPLFRNVSVFKRSYDLMVRLLKIYVYKEGKKPIFHNPRLRGLYAAEGWFMKLLMNSKHFTVKDPKKAHLFYLPFSVESLRKTLYDEKSHSMKNMEQYLADYLDLIKTRYPFWNWTEGADHFFVACHDWGTRITMHHLSSSIRGLCNANIARGFTIGKDVSIPVTYIRTRFDPTGSTGGQPPSNRTILAFFAGQSHGYFRPLLLKYWENKFPDMKIVGSMQREVQGKAVYQEYMKSSKYCICARGYEVHTPRVVESILNECVPVFLSDNYVPPFFEVLDWEAFSVFIQEREILNLRNILLSISNKRYLAMQWRLRIVRKHFIWHEKPEKYDLFHMILHSVWYNRIYQMKVDS